jgi:hypothetical protein
MVKVPATPASCWSLESMPMGPPAMMDTPPMFAAFSTRMVFAPFCWDARAAAIPDAPAPTTTVSQLSLTVSPSEASAAFIS